MVIFHQVASTSLIISKVPSKAVDHFIFELRLEGVKRKATEWTDSSLRKRIGKFATVLYPLAYEGKSCLPEVVDLRH